MKLEDITAHLRSDGERNLGGMHYRVASGGHGDGVSSGRGSGAAAASAVALQSAAAGEGAYCQNREQDNATVPPEFAWQRSSLNQKESRQGEDGKCNRENRRSRCGDSCGCGKREGNGR